MDRGASGGGSPPPVISSTAGLSKSASSRMRSSPPTKVLWAHAIERRMPSCSWRSSSRRSVSSDSLSAATTGAVGASVRPFPTASIIASSSSAVTVPTFLSLASSTECSSSISHWLAVGTIALAASPWGSLHSASQPASGSPPPRTDEPMCGGSTSTIAQKCTSSSSASRRHALGATLLLGTRESTWHNPWPFLTL